MFIKAQHDYDIDLSNSYMIGDKYSDIEAAKNAKLKKAFLVKNNNLMQIVSKILLIDEKI